MSAVFRGIALSLVSGCLEPVSRQLGDEWTDDADDSSATDDSDAPPDDTGTKSCLPAEGPYAYDAGFTKWEQVTDTKCVPKDKIDSYMTAFGFSDGMHVSQAEAKRFTLEYERLSVAPTCVMKSDCSYACELAEESVALHTFAVSATLVYTIETHGWADATADLAGTHTVTLDLECNTTVDPGATKRARRQSRTSTSRRPVKRVPSGELNGPASSVGSTRRALIEWPAS